MEFDNSFEVPLPPAQAWAVLMDVPRIAPCMPGAELIETIDAQNYRGKISVRLGPVALAFVGLVSFEHIDPAGYTARVKAQGSDAKGRGAANATATFGIEPSGSGSRVLVHTDLALSGAVAQYGRGVGMIQATAAQIIGQFASNLRAQLAGMPAAVGVPPGAPAATVPAQAAAVPSRGGAPEGSQPPAFIRRSPSTAPAAPTSAPPSPAAKPISGLSLIARVLWDRMVAMFAGRSRG
jgi:carbon monoxide dehydrogenase subunit G